MSNDPNVSTDGQTKYGETVRFMARYSDNPEDNSFAAATPSASTEMFISNPNLYGHFAPGKVYYFDITEVPEAKEEQDAE